MSFYQRIHTPFMHSAFKDLKKKTHKLLNLRNSRPDAPELPEYEWHNATSFASHHCSSMFNPLDDEDDDMVIYGKQVSSSSPNGSPTSISSVPSSDSGHSNATQFDHPVYAMLEDLLGPEEDSEDSPHGQESTTSPSTLESLGMALWLSEYMSRLVMGHSSAYKCYTTNSFRGQQQFCKLLKVMQVQPVTVLCALFYLSKLFPRGIVYDSNTPRTGLDINTLAIRVFSVGCVLATKWLQDEATTLSWWALESGLSTRAFNRLEKTALRLFDYDISISQNEFRKWNLELYRHSSLIQSRPSSVFVRQLLERNIVACSLPMPTGLSRRMRVLAEGPLMNELYCGLMQTSLPAEWKPEVDPIVSRTEKRNGMAPCRPTRAKSLDHATMKSNHQFGSYFDTDSQVDWFYPGHSF